MKLLDRMKYELRQSPKKNGQVVVTRMDLERLIHLAESNQKNLDIETASQFYELMRRIAELENKQL